MNLNQKIIISDNVFAQEVDNEMVLLDMNTENYFGLDEVGCSIWQQMQEQELFQDVYKNMLEIYDVEPERLLQDIEEFVVKLNNWAAFPFLIAISRYPIELKMAKSSPILVSLYF